MKPSEYFYSMDNGKLYIPTKQIVLDMDKRFIDREELKDKINDIDIWHKNGLQLKKEILELVK